MSDDETDGMPDPYFERIYGPVLTPFELTNFLAEKGRVTCECGGTYQVDESIYNVGKAFVGAIVSPKEDEVVSCYVLSCDRCATMRFVSIEMLANIRGTNAGAD